MSALQPPRVRAGPELPPATLGKAVALGIAASRAAPAESAAAVSAAATAAAIMVLLAQVEIYSDENRRSIVKVATIEGSDDLTTVSRVTRGSS